jgi:hypothetical protein
MIEKLKGVDYEDGFPGRGHLMSKLNEVIDAVNLHHNMIFGQVEITSNIMTFKDAGIVIPLAGAGPNDTEMLDWMEAHSGEYYRNACCLNYYDNAGELCSVTGADLRDCIRQAMEEDKT